MQYDHLQWIQIIRRIRDTFWNEYNLVSLLLVIKFLRKRKPISAYMTFSLIFTHRMSAFTQRLAKVFEYFLKTEYLSQNWIKLFEFSPQIRRISSLNDM